MTFPSRVISIHHHLPPVTDAELAWREACYKYLGAAFRGAHPSWQRTLAEEMFIAAEAMRMAKAREAR